VLRHRWFLEVPGAVCLRQGQGTVDSMPTFMESANARRAILICRRGDITASGRAVVRIASRSARAPGMSRILCSASARSTVPPSPSSDHQQAASSGGGDPGARQARGQRGPSSLRKISMAHLPAAWVSVDQLACSTRSSRTSQSSGRSSSVIAPTWSPKERSVSRPGHVVSATEPAPRCLHFCSHPQTSRRSNHRPKAQSPHNHAGSESCARRESNSRPAV
jgi:hypothetical protein